MQDFDAAAKVRERLIRYARVDTQSRHFEGSWPTTRTQFDLARMLRDELEDMGADDVWLDEEACVVYALLPSTRPDGGGLPFGLIAHMDTAPDAPGSGVNPWVLEHYDGGDIVLNPEKHIVMRADEYPNLAQYIGQDLVLTDGTTLLGGDDKAALALCLSLMRRLADDPTLPHPRLAFAFVPDEDAGTYSNISTDAFSVSAITAAQARANRFLTPDGMPFLCDFDTVLIAPELEEKAKKMFGENARLTPTADPESDLNAANPVYGMRYLVMGGGADGFTAKQWAVCDRRLMKELVNIVYNTRPVVMQAPQDNPLKDLYTGYVVPCWKKRNRPCWQ